MDELLSIFESKLSTRDPADIIQQFTEVLNTDERTAEFFLESACWDVRLAVNNYLSTIGDSSLEVYDPEPSQSLITPLLQCGFSLEAICSTLRASSNNMFRAAEWLIEHAAENSAACDELAKMMGNVNVQDREVRILVILSSGQEHTCVCRSSERLGVVYEEVSRMERTTHFVLVGEDGTLFSDTTVLVEDTPLAQQECSVYVRTTQQQ